ncbi:MAG: dolichol kinase [Chlorobi bacterium]|nr:dolichol kinase [Chlorobiota bacterium]
MSTRTVEQNAKLPFLHRADDISFGAELLRKGIHLLSLSIPIGYALMSKGRALSILIPLTLVFVIADVLIHWSEPVRSLAMRIVGPLLRPHERRQDRMLLNGASYVLIGACITIAIFPKLIAVTALAILIVSDISAAIIGRRYGRHRLFDKTLEGTLAFFVAALIVIGVIGSLYRLAAVYYIVAAIAAAVGAIVENISIRLKMDDNISIPLSIGIVMWAVAEWLPSGEHLLGIQ